MANIDNKKNLGTWEKAVVVRVGGEINVDMIFPFKNRQRMSDSLHTELAFQVASELDAVRREKGIELPSTEENVKSALMLVERWSYSIKNVELSQHDLHLDNGETFTQRNLSAHHMGWNNHPAESIRLLHGA